MVKNKRDYRHEIYEILEKNGGKVKGFNHLSRLGNFHRGSLGNHLRDMESSGGIISIRSGTSRTEYLIPEINSQTFVKQIFSDIIKLQEKLDKSNPKDKKRISLCILKKLINYYQMSDVMLRLGLYDFQFDGMKVNLLKACIEWLDMHIILVTLNLTQREQENFVKSNFYNNTWKNYLKKHQLAWKKYNVH